MNHLIICGYDPGARMLLDAVLNEEDPDKTTLIIFAPMERPNDIPDEFEWIIGDPTKESELAKARMVYANACIVVGDRNTLPQLADAKTILMVFTIRSYLQRHHVNKQRKNPLYITAEILDSENVNHAVTSGADEVIESRKIGFSLLAHAVHHKGSANIMGEIVSAGHYNLYIGLPGESIFLPCTYREVAWQFKKIYGAMLIGVQLPDGESLLNPSDGFTVNTDNKLVYLAREQCLEEL